MNKQVRRLILATVAAAVVSIAAAYLLFPIHDAIGGYVGIVFWTAAALAAEMARLKAEAEAQLQAELEVVRREAEQARQAHLDAQLEVFLGSPQHRAIMTQYGFTDHDVDALAAG